MNTVATRPECPLERPARGDFSRMAMPLLIASANQQQLDDFLWEQGLVCAEARRLKGDSADLARLPYNKILILLPEWWTCPVTDRAVQAWVEELDRYSVQLESPLPPQRRAEQRTMTAMIILTIIALVLSIVWKVMS